MANHDPKRVVTGKVRLSYVHLFTPFANQPGAEPKFSVTLLIPKSDIATKQRIDAAIQAAIEEGISTKWNGVRPPQIHLPIHDGDGVRPSDGMPFGKECKGHWVMTASSKQKPEIVDINLNPIIDQTQIYSGIYGRVSIRFFPYNAAGKKGIGCGLGNVQKLEDGEPLGGRRSAADDFGDLAPPAAASGYPAQPPAAQPTTPGYPPAQAGQPPAYPGYPPNQAYPPQTYPQQPATPVQIDPITGKPLQGGIMGL